MTIEEHEHASIETAAAEGTQTVQDSFLRYLQIKQFQLVNTHSYMIFTLPHQKWTCSCKDSL
jgi:hypothetical protein